MPLETISYTITGANGPVTKTVQVDVDLTSGSGSAQITYTGTNAGTPDTVTATATIAGNSYTSNSAQVNWQPTNGTVQIGDEVKFYGWSDSPHNTGESCYPRKNANDPATATFSGDGLGSLTVMNLSTAACTATGSSLVIDDLAAWPGLSTGPSSSSGAPRWCVYTAAGVYSTYTSPTPGAVSSSSIWSQNDNYALLGWLVVPKAGQYTFSCGHATEAIWGIGGGATRISGSSSGTIRGQLGQVMTAANGYPLLDAGWYSGCNVSNWLSGTCTVSFPSPGLYPIEVDWDVWYHSGRGLNVSLNTGVITPVGIVSAPPLNDGTGNLTITPSGGNANLVFQGNQVTLTVNVSGIEYSQTPYLPILEGTPASLNIYNSTQNTFTFPTFPASANSFSLTSSAGAQEVFQLSGTDNSKWMGRFAVSYSDSAFVLGYNGNPFDIPMPAVTNLTIQCDDVAWFDAANGSVDLYTPSSPGIGGALAQVEVDWMPIPKVTSVSNTTNLTANGATVSFGISLDKGFTPQQQGTYNTGNTVVSSVSLPGCVGTPTLSPTYDGSGNLTGWTVTAQLPTSSTPVTLSLNLTVTGNLTYLSGNTFVTQTVNYISGQIATIPLAGAGLVAPTHVSFTVSPATVAETGTVTLTAQVFSANATAPSCVMQGIDSTGSIFTIGTPTATTTAGTINGQSGFITTYTLSFPAVSGLNAIPGDYLGYTATANGLKVSYTTTTRYYRNNPSLPQQPVIPTS